MSMNFITYQYLSRAWNRGKWKHKIRRQYIVIKKQSRTVENNICYFFHFIFLTIFKLQMHVNIQKLLEMPLMQTSHLYAKQAFPRWAALTWWPWGGRATHDVERAISLSATSVGALCPACQQVPAGIPVTQQDTLSCELPPPRAPGGIAV